MNTLFATTPLFSRMVEAQNAAKTALFADPLLNLREAAAVLGCSVPTLRQIVKDKRVPIFRSSPKAIIKIRASALDAFMKAGAQ
jgi:excisionase family DNA binding protein